jgi:cytochrome P450
MSDQQVRDEVVTSFIAGHETPANGLSWILYLLAAHPLDCERLVAELDTIAIDALPGTAALGEIPFLECVIKESLRLYPPAWIVVRTPREDDTIAGYSVPAGATILISQYVLQRHPAYWEHPEAFVPERWAPENAASLPRGAYFPFGGGSRTCTGIVLAKAILRLVVAAVSRRYRLETVPGQRVTPQPLTTLRPRGGVLVRVTER